MDRMQDDFESRVQQVTVVSQCNHRLFAYSFSCSQIANLLVFHSSLDKIFEKKSSWPAKSGGLLIYLSQRISIPKSLAPL
jgi:hypothetical protein